MTLTYRILIGRTIFGVAYLAPAVPFLSIVLLSRFRVRSAYGNPHQEGFARDVPGLQSIYRVSRNETYTT